MIIFRPSDFVPPAVLVVQEMPTLEKVTPALFALWMLWQVLDRYVLNKGKYISPDDIHSLRQTMEANAEGHKLHERDTSEGLAMSRRIHELLLEMNIHNKAAHDDLIDGMRGLERSRRD